VAVCLDSTNHRSNLQQLDSFQHASFGLYIYVCVIYIYISARMTRRYLNSAMMFCAPFPFQPVMRHAGAVPMAHGNDSLHRPQEERQGHHCRRTWGKCLSWKSDPGLLETQNLLLGSWKRASPVVPLLCSVSLAWSLHPSNVGISAEPAAPSFSPAASLQTPNLAGWSHQKWSWC
jgi:hypothetical protein